MTEWVGPHCLCSSRYKRLLALIVSLTHFRVTKVDRLNERLSQSWDCGHVCGVILLTVLLE